MGALDWPALRNVFVRSPRQGRRLRARSCDFVRLSTAPPLPRLVLGQRTLQPSRGHVVARLRGRGTAFPRPAVPSDNEIYTFENEYLALRQAARFPEKPHLAFGLPQRGCLAFSEFFTQHAFRLRPRLRRNQRRPFRPCIFLPDAFATLRGANINMEPMRPIDGGISLPARVLDQALPFHVFYRQPRARLCFLGFPH